MALPKLLFLLILSLGLGELYQNITGTSPLELLVAFKDILSSYVWGWPANWWPGTIPLLVILLLGTGIFVTLRLGFVQIRFFTHAWKVIRGDFDNPEHNGDISHFQALSAALSATIGIGNIAGVATAIHYGGPGALFWMWLTAFFGMALKFAEATLAIKYRVINPDGSASGGPMFYILHGLGEKWKWMAVAFASFTILSSFGQGNMIQSFTVSDQLHTDFGIPRIVTALILTGIVGAVIIGGIKRIGVVTARLTPAMAVIYFTGALLVIIFNITNVPAAFATIFREAFSPTAGVAGTAGGGFLVFLNTMLWGVKRGLFSNEAGQGSAPIAHGAAKTDEPVREGVVAMIGPFIDTLVICTMTGLVITVTGAYLMTDATGSLLNGSPLTAMGFTKGLSLLGDWGGYIVTVAVILFATSTAISWSYYGDRSVQFIWGDKAILPYRIVYLVMVLLGGIFSLELVWGLGDVAVGLMAFPNLIAVILLSGKVKEMTRDYRAKDR